MALNVDANNRQLHEDEKQRIKALAKGNAKLEQELTDAACFRAHCSAGKNNDDISKADLQAKEQAVKDNVDGKYTQALAMLDADTKATSLFSYTAADKALDALVAADPRSVIPNGRGLTTAEEKSKAASLKACGNNTTCVDQTTASYQRMVSDRNEQALNITTVLTTSQTCTTNECRTQSIAQMYSLLNDLKAKGVGIEDNDRIALSTRMAVTYEALGSPGKSLNQFAIALIGTMGSEAGNKGNLPGVGGKSTKVSEEVVPPVTSGGTANSATVPGLKGQLANENLANIAAQDARLAKAVNGSGGASANFSVGSGTAAEADQLGKTWVGDGAKLVGDQAGCPGCWKSADGLRIYRPPTPKDAPVAFNPTGVQANFVTLSINPTTGVSKIVGNGHLVVLP
jgi:hypothetical protein